MKEYLKNVIIGKSIKKGSILLYIKNRHIYMGCVQKIANIVGLTTYP